MKAPQDRKTPYKFSEWNDEGPDDTGVSPSVRAEASSTRITFERRALLESTYQHAFAVYGREGAEELRDYLDAWLDAQEDSSE